MNDFSPLQKLFEDGLLWTEQRLPLQYSDPSIQTILATFGIPEIDDSLPLGGLNFGALHECVLTNEITSRVPYRWYPPLLLISALIGRSFEHYTSAPLLSPTRKELIAWVGSKCWPNPQLLYKCISKNSLSSANESKSWINNCLLVNPRGKEQRFWASTQLLRCPSIFALIVDGSGFDATAFRRLHLAAKKGNVLGIILRPPWESIHGTALSTQWEIKPIPSRSNSPEWSIRLLRGKGKTLISSGKKRKGDRPEHWPKQWFVRWDKEGNNGKGAFCIASSPDGERQKGAFLSSSA